MADSCDTYLEGCLYFSSNSLTRRLNEMADEAFKFTDMAAAYSYLMLIIIDKPGLSQGELGKIMNLKASTITRFVDKLIEKAFVERITKNRFACIYATEEGKNFRVIIEQALKMLHQKYIDKLGEEQASKLVADIQYASIQLES